MRTTGIALPAFPTTTVGSLPSERSARDWIEFEEAIGIDVPTDGRFVWVDHVFGRLEGVRRAERAGRHYWLLESEVARPAPVEVALWRESQSLSRRPLKAVLPGPYTLRNRVVDAHYPSRAAAVIAIARALREELEDLVRAGVLFVQIDEPDVPPLPDGVRLAAEALAIMTSDLSAYVSVHLDTATFVEQYALLQGLPVDNLDVGLALPPGLPIERVLSSVPPSRDLTLGVVSRYAADPESVQQIVSFVRGLPPTVPRARIWLHPDCGLRSLDAQTVQRKLSTLVEAASLLRREQLP